MRELLRLHNLPVYQNRMYDTAEEARACIRGDVVLAQDEITGLISNISFDPGKLEYDENYQNEQGYSSVFQSHLSEVMSIINRHFQAMRILEIGCGKGSFLELLLKEGHDAIGVDPAYEGNAPHIIKAAFDSKLGVSGEAIIMRHVLEHIPGPLAFLESVKQANAGQGLIYIEVPCLDWILDNRVWFDIFYEHVNYFRLSDLKRIFGNVVESGYLFGGQYIYIIADLETLENPIKLREWIPATISDDFFIGIENCLISCNREKQCVVWGAGAKGVMFCNHAIARGLAIDFVIDISPAKQGKFMAATGLKVLSPNDALAQMLPGADIIVMNSNYLAEVQSLAGPNYHYTIADKILATSDAVYA